MSECTYSELDVLEAVKDGRLEIRPDGSVWRLASRYKCRWTGRVSLRPITPRLLGGIDSTGYIRVRVDTGGNVARCFAHRLVWTVFNGRIPDGLQINHKNGIKTDNRLENLELVTPKENMRHACRLGLNPTRGERHPFSKLTEREVASIRSEYAAGAITQANLGAKYGVSQTVVSSIVLRDTWRPPDEEHCRVSMDKCGDRNPAAKLTNQHVEMMRCEYREKKTPYRELAMRFGVTKSTVHRVIREKTWQEVGR